LFISCNIHRKDLTDLIKLLDFFMLQPLVIIEFVPGIKHQITDVALVGENVREVLGLDMVLCAGTVLMGKLVTEGAVEPSILGISVHKLE